MSKVIFINRFFYPDQSATSQLLYDLVKNLQLGPDIKLSVVTSRRVMSSPQTLLAEREEIDGVDVHRVYTTSFGKKRLLGRSLDFVIFYITSFYALLKIVNKNDIVIIKTDPPLISLPSMVAVKIKKGMYINWLQDIYPEVASRLGIKGVDGFLGKLLVKLRNICVKNAFCNVVLGEVMASHVESMGVNKSNIKIIHNWSDGSSICPIEKDDNHLIKEWGLEGKFVVCYSGNMGRAHEFDTILNAIESIKYYEDIVFIFIGDGAKKQWLEEQAKLRSLNNVLFRPFQEFSELAYSLSIGDVHLISLIPDLEGLIVPSKLYGVMAAGRPCLFVGSKHGEVSKILKNSDCGYAFEIGDADGLVDKILTLYKSNELLEELSRHARSVYLKKYDKPVAMNEWNMLLQNSLGQK